MQEFVARENIKRFKAQLRSSFDEHQKIILRNLLKAEQQRLKSILDRNEPDTPQIQNSRRPLYEQHAEGGRR